ncbi:hypothetical protein GC093_10540 [Paenibacillus sp. LMG 31456]|uniref:Uncharacterized protein n=1 Tax=Paenibacillus foliorum TaxID=2654974 RepID=A0A972GMS6_9BACL|nr:hypothetical protein [Paenibacillus foliorum]NOU93656.1 hypothetical protein [Paenibacillus foliorum]
MESVRVAKLSTKVSLVVCLLDSYTSSSPLGLNASILLEGTLSKPIITSKGTFIFNDLQAGGYRLRVNVPYYFEECRDIEVGLENTLVHVTLSPRPSYPFREKDTLLRASVSNEHGQPYSKAILLAVMQSENGARARLAQDKAGQGTDQLTIGSVTGKISVGDRYLIRSRNSSEVGEELCLVEEVLEYQRRLRLERPLIGSYARGSLLLPVVKTQSDERGEVVVAFANCRANRFDIKLDVAHSGRSLSKEVNLTEGGTTLAGKWKF